MEQYRGHALRKGRVSISGQIYLITVVSRKRKPIFFNLGAARILVKELYSNSLDVETLCYVIMPDHLHWLVRLGDEVSLSVLMQQVKSKSGFYIKKLLGLKEPVWQSGFHDRALRKDEDVKTVARYVIANPLRAGLVVRVEDYALWDACWLG